MIKLNNYPNKHSYKLIIGLKPEVHIFLEIYNIQATKLYFNTTSPHKPKRREREKKKMIGRKVFNCQFSPIDTTYSLSEKEIPLNNVELFNR